MLPAFANVRIGGGPVTFLAKATVVSISAFGFSITLLLSSNSAKTRLVIVSTALANGALLLFVSYSALVFSNGSRACIAPIFAR